MTFWGKVIAAWRQSHPLVKVGVIGWLLFLVAERWVLATTPAARWNGPRHVREQEMVWMGQAASWLLIIAGRGWRLLRSERGESGPTSP